ncbi:hypothetical protein MASR2M117_02840 [Paludibacter sp.]
MKLLFKFSILALLVFCANNSIAQDLTGIKIHINPGHGGWDSDDRGIATPLFPSVGPNVGFWESQSNLDKGLQLKEMLETLGATVQISRTQNRTQDDLPLSQIVRMANEFQSDFMLSIHSNAGAGTANYVLMLYAGKNPDDPNSYPTPIPRSEESRLISTEIAKNLIKNKMTHWTAANYNVSGDKTYARLYMGWSDGYGVTRGLTVPGVISEGSMHDYIPETYRLMNMDYKWLEAWNFKKAFCTYFKNAEIPTGNIAGTIKDSRNLILDGTYTKYGKDVLLPLNGATVTVMETGQTYTVDNNRNGVYVFKDLQPGVYNIKAEAEGYYAQTKAVTVLKNEINYLSFELNKVRNTAPQVVKYSPNVALNDSVIPSTDIVLEFNWDMDETTTREAFSITPAVAGKLTFEDSQYRLRFKPDMPLEKATLYTVKLAKTAKHPDNISLTEDFTFQFVTKSRNRLALLESYPYDGAKKVDASKPLFFFIFDKALNSSNIRDEINVYDSANKEISKGTRSIKINKLGESFGDIYFELTEALVPGGNYKIKLGANAMDATGVKLVDPIEINFKAVNVGVADKLVIDDFETDGKYVYDETNSYNSSLATFNRNTSKKLFGSASYNLKSTFTDNDAHAIFKLNTPISNTAQNRVFGLHVYGDMSGNELQLYFQSTEIASDILILKLCDLNFMGWEFVEAQVPESPIYTLAGIRIARKEGILSKSSDIYVDNLLQYPEPILGVRKHTSDSSIKIFPNPASDFIFISTENKTAPLLKLYSLNGVLLKAVNDNRMIVSEFPTGTYILKISTEKGEYSKVIMIGDW